MDINHEILRIIWLMPAIILIDIVSSLRRYSGYYGPTPPVNKTRQAVRCHSKTILVRMISRPLHVYSDRVDFRVIVMTYKRVRSLLVLLKSLDDLELDGHRISLEIWIDRSRGGKVDEDT